jgi:hypothetical protein
MSNLVARGRSLAYPPVIRISSSNSNLRTADRTSLSFDVFSLLDYYLDGWSKMSPPSRCKSLLF